MMRWSLVRTVLGKELRETLRDRRTLLMMIVVPTLLYPAIFVVIEQLALFGERQLSAEPAAVAVSGADHGLLAFLEADPALRIVAAESATVAAVRQGKVTAAVIVGGAGAPRGGGAAAETTPVRVLFDASIDRSQRGRDVVQARLAAWEDTLLARRIRGAGLPASFAEPLHVSQASVATAEEAGGYALGRFLPVVLILMTLLGAFYPAIDLAAGEKERGTLETLLTAPVPAREIVTGKFLAVALIGFAAAAANLASLLLTFQSGLFRFARAADLSLTLPAHSAALVLVGLIPLSVLFAALFLGIAVRSQSFKEAQNALTPVQLASTLPVLVVTLPGIAFTPALALVPVVGIALLFRELMAGTAAVLPSLLALASTIGYAALALGFASRAFGREDILFGRGGSEPRATAEGWRARVRAWRSASRGVPGPGEGLLFLSAVGVAYFHFGTGLIAAAGERGLLAAQWLLLALPAVALASLGPFDARRTLALRGAGVRTLVGALLIVLGGIPIGWALGWLQLQLLPGAADALGYLEALVTATDARRAAWLLVLVALTPAVCEELVFRGVLLQSFRRELRAASAIALSALIFGAFHLSFETAIRFLPTAWLGVLLGFVAWHSRSLFASMLMHFVNNAVVVLLLWKTEVAAFFVSGEAPNWWVVAVALPVLFLGGAILPRRGAEHTDPAAASAASR